jgi:uncharacterized membrane protein
MPEIEHEVHVACPPERVYEMWRDPKTFVQLVGSLEDAERDGRTLRWEASGPLGLTLQGEAEITREKKPEEIAWNTIEGALDAHGHIRFEPEDGGTRVRYVLSYEVPGGPAGKAVAGMTDPEQHIRATLERFKALAEGE